LALGAEPHRTWMGYWRFSLDQKMSTQSEEYKVNSITNEDWVEAASNKVEVVVPFELESSNAIGVMALILYSRNVVEGLSPSL